MKKLVISFKALRDACDANCRICDERNCHIWQRLVLASKQATDTQQSATRPTHEPDSTQVKPDCSYCIHFVVCKYYKVLRKAGTCKRYNPA